jgi:hypothetical protein
MWTMGGNESKDKSSQDKEAFTKITGKIKKEKKAMLACLKFMNLHRYDFSIILYS